jgi:RNA polymerase sigma-70 factor (ECF subfamily)
MSRSRGRRRSRHGRGGRQRGASRFIGFIRLEPSPNQCISNVVSAFVRRRRILQMSDTRSHVIRDLFTRNKRDLLAYFTRRVGREDASDLLQETFARVLRRNQLEAVANPSGYLRRTASNLATDFARRRKMEFKYVISDDARHDAPSDDESAEQLIESDQRSEMLNKAIETLPPRCRQVFVMRMLEDVPQDEIASRLGISKNMVDRHLRIAIERCRMAVK